MDKTHQIQSCIYLFLSWALHKVFLRVLAAAGCNLALTVWHTYGYKTQLVASRSILRGLWKSWCSELQWLEETLIFKIC